MYKVEFISTFKFHAKGTININKYNSKNHQKSNSQFDIQYGNDLQPIVFKEYFSFFSLSNTINPTKLLDKNIKEYYRSEA